MANWYERTIVPHIIRLGCGCAGLAEFRRSVVPQASGRVLEIGFGAGANLIHYDSAIVAEVVGIEPSPELRAIAARAPRVEGLRIDLQPGHGERLPFPDASFDSVVCTYTLCTVQDPDHMLAEARRVLRPGGLFLFSEHGRSPDPGIARWQEWLDPLWSRIFGGCHITRAVGASIGRHFTIAAHDGRYMQGAPKLAGWMEWGRAVAA